MLNFIGIGSAFNTKLGNNGAFIKSEDGKTLFLIDCGETTYSLFNQLNLLDGVEYIHVLMTHFHPDHCGSLGSLAFHMYYMMEPFQSRITVYTPDLESVHELFDLTGVREEYYNELRLTVGIFFYGHINKIRAGSLGDIFVVPVKVPHAKTIDSYGYYITIGETTMYYSGDSKVIPDDVLMHLCAGKIHIMYQDVSTHDYDDNPHLSITKLDNIIPKDNDIRSKIYCMHLDKAWKNELATERGFNVVTRYEPIIKEEV